MQIRKLGVQNFWNSERPVRGNQSYMVPYLFKKLLGNFLNYQSNGRKIKKLFELEALSSFL